MKGWCSGLRGWGLWGMQVRRFSILMSNFSVMTGELKPDGTLDRLKIKKQWKSDSAPLPP